LSRENEQEFDLIILLWYNVVNNNGGGTIMEDLSDRQQQILNFIMKEIDTKGYPPAVREIADAVGLSSPSTVHSHLTTLEKKGYIRKDPTKPRSIVLFKIIFSIMLVLSIIKGRSISLCFCWNLLII
jgi:DNA-binding MarR family transcriptional regulator